MARHPGVTNARRWLDSSHLPEEKRAAPRVIEEAADKLLNMIPVDSAELTEGMRYLILAKDCMVRAKIVSDTEAV